VRASNCAAQPPQANCGSVSDGPGTLQRCQIQMGFRLTFFLNTVSRLASTVAARNISPAIVPMIIACTARSNVWRIMRPPVGQVSHRWVIAQYRIHLDTLEPCTEDCSFGIFTLCVKQGGRRTSRGLLPLLLYA